jgi:hypothetical protein
MKACQQLSQQVFSWTRRRAAYLYIKKKRKGGWPCTKTAHSWLTPCKHFKYSPVSTKTTWPDPRAFQGASLKQPSNWCNWVSKLTLDSWALTIACPCFFWIYWTLINCTWEMYVFQFMQWMWCTVRNLSHDRPHLTFLHFTHLVLH